MNGFLAVTPPDLTGFAVIDDPVHAIGIIRMANADDLSGGCIHLDAGGDVGE